MTMKKKIGLLLMALVFSSLLCSCASQNPAGMADKRLSSRLFSVSQPREDSSDSVMILRFVLCQLGAKLLDFRVLL